MVKIYEEKKACDWDSDMEISLDLVIPIKQPLNISNIIIFTSTSFLQVFRKCIFTDDFGIDADQVFKSRKEFTSKAQAFLLESVFQNLERLHKIVVNVIAFIGVCLSA